MQKYEITLKNEKEKLYNQLSWVIIIIHIITLLYLGFFSSNRVVYGTCILTLSLLAVIYILRHYLFKTKWKAGLLPFFGILFLGWLNMYQYWMSVIPLAFGILSSISTRKLVAIFSNDHIYYPTFPAKTINWKTLNNVILKDGLLTIDLKSNKLIQQFIDEKISLINEKEFNEFCRQRLNK